MLRSPRFRLNPDRLWSSRRRPQPNLHRHRTGLNSVPITYTSNEQVEVYRFSIPAAVLIPLSALFLQAFVPLRLGFFSIFDLPLLVVIFFAVARRSQVSGMLTGAVIGLLQDSLTHQPIGVYGIAKTVVGYGASSLGVKIDVENAGSRFLVTLFFYIAHEIVYFTIARGLVGLTLHWSWLHELGAAFANALVAVPMFVLLDRFKQRT
ncbi:MAG: rod shape-determining protein MreD [Acidobacteriia bacterium]|nr:rod shape-determining protein MreD [Terriglobia bacterium]